MTVGDTGKVGLCAHMHVKLPVPVYTACLWSMREGLCSRVHVVHVCAHVHLYTSTCVCAFAKLTMLVHTHIGVREHPGEGYRSLASSSSFSSPSIPSSQSLALTFCFLP